MFNYQWVVSWVGFGFSQDFHVIGGFVFWQEAQERGRRREERGRKDPQNIYSELLILDQR